ncbi:serine hydrolase domain-containing protein [Pendulispora albinea]|uniref:Beta-lactamase family protein n=1 Tax=Pendulispora albinea TaxID=2741071 RepID=A0ABZ2LV87_9BACT
MSPDTIVRLVFASLVLVGCAEDTSPNLDERSSGARTVQEDDQRATPLQRGLDRLHAGGVIGVVARGSDGVRVIDARSGSARRNSTEPVAFESQFRMGSNTKTFVAVVMLQLVDEGKIRLDDTVDRWLPGLVSGHGNDGKKITMRHLLQHTSGLRDYSDDLLEDFTEKDYYAKRFQHFDPEELVTTAIAHEPKFAPGTGWSYSNTNYTLAAMIIEKVTGHDWSTEVRTRILEPLQMWHTFEPGDWADLPAPHAQGYNSFSAGQPPIDVTLFNMSWGGAAGSLITTTEDLTRFWRALQGGELLSPARMAEMHDTVPATELHAVFPGLRDGLGIFWSPTRCGGFWHHPGDTPGFSTRNAVNDGGTRSVVLSENTTGGVSVASRAKDELQLLEDVMCADR